MNKLLIIILLTFSLKSQSLDSLINEALMNNAGLKSFGFYINSAKSKAESVNYLPAPEFEITFDQIPFGEWNGWDKGFSQSFGISQMIPLGKKPSSMKNVEMKETSVIKREFENYKLNLIKNVKEYYYKLWMMDHHIVLKRRNSRLLSYILESAQTMYETNKLSMSDILIIKSSLAESNVQILTLENEFDGIRAKLNVLLGRDFDNDDVHINHKEEFNINMVDEYNINLEENPSLNKMDEMIEMKKLSIVANDKELIPDLMLKGMIMRMPQGMFLTEKSNIHSSMNGKTEWMYGIMASITLPFVPWSSNNIKYKNEELENSISGLREEKEEMKRRMTAEVSELLFMEKNKRKEILLYENDVIPLYEQALETMINEFSINKTSVSTLLEFINMVLMKKEMLAELRAEHQMTVAEIEAMTGFSINMKKGN